MAVKSLINSSGLAALAAGVAAVALPAAASAQEGRWHHGGNGQAQTQTPTQTQVQPQTQTQGNGGNWQHRGNGEARGNGGNWAGRTQGQVHVAPQVQVAPQQVQRNWSGGSNWRQNQVQEQLNQNRVQSYNGQNRWSGQNRTYNQGWQNRRYDGNRTWSGRTTQWNNNWRRDNRYDWQSYRNANRNVFRMGRYYSPYSNWSYRRLGAGFFLEPLFYSNNYWITDPWQYRLPEAYGPYRWVRYYDDALLVDVYSGEVVDAIYDFFW